MGEFLVIVPQFPNKSEDEKWSMSTGEALRLRLNILKIQQEQGLPIVITFGQSISVGIQLSDHFTLNGCEGKSIIPVGTVFLEQCRGTAMIPCLNPVSQMYLIVETKLEALMHKNATTQV